MDDVPNKYEPYQDQGGDVAEDCCAYVQRMKATLLPHWPDEVLREWLHRHAGSIDTYVFLEFETFSFAKQIWPLSRIPGREAFEDEVVCDQFSNVEERAEQPGDWLAQYMVREGTWNTPIVLLDNQHGQWAFPDGSPLKQPYHLLEGHHRLAFLNTLRVTGKARAEHEVWVVTKDT